MELGPQCLIISSFHRALVLVVKVKVKVKVKVDISSKSIAVSISIWDDNDRYMSNRLLM